MKKKRFFLLFYLLDRRWRWLTFCAICDNESERLLVEVFDSSNDELWSYVCKFLLPLTIVVGRIEFDGRIVGWWRIPVSCCVVNVVVSLVRVAEKKKLEVLFNFLKRKITLLLHVNRRTGSNSCDCLRRIWD